MKIWKIAAQPRYYGVEDPEYVRNHDYEPEQDHEVISRPRGRMVQAFQQAALDIQNKHMSNFEGYFRRFRIEFVKDIGFLGKYINGTYHEPVIVVNLRECHKTQIQMKNEYPTMYSVAITTLMHELKHAMQDAEGKLEDETDVEDEAEDFGMRFWARGN